MFPAFAFALAQAIEYAEARLQRRLRIVECGGGTGELGQRILSYLSDTHDYVVIESSPSRIESHSWRIQRLFHEIAKGYRPIMSNPIFQISCQFCFISEEHAYPPLLPKPSFFICC